MWIWDDQKQAIVNKSITFTPGLYKIFDEIIGNYQDQKLLFIRCVLCFAVHQKEILIQS